MLVCTASPKQSEILVQNLPTPSEFPLSPGWPQADSSLVMSGGTAMSAGASLCWVQAETRHTVKANQSLLMRRFHHIAPLLVNYFVGSYVGGWRVSPARGGRVRRVIPI